MAKGVEAEGEGKKRAQYVHSEIDYLEEKKKDVMRRRSELNQQQVIPPWLYNALA